MKVKNLTRNTILAENVQVASSLFFRMKGLLGRATFNDNEALIIRPCNSIHTFFMRFRIDAIFLDKQQRVVGLEEDMAPFKISRIFPKASSVLELPAHKISKTQTAINDLIEFSS